MFVRICCLSLMVFAGTFAANRVSAQVFYPFGPAVVPVAPVYASPFVAARPVIAPVAPVSYSAQFAPTQFSQPQFSQPQFSQPQFSQSQFAATQFAPATYSAGFAPAPAVSVFRPALSVAPVAAPVITPVYGFRPAAVVRSKVYIPGRPIRNFARAITP